MGIAGSSLTLANATIRRQSVRALDIGTGYTSEITPRISKFLHRCNGTRTVGDIIQELAGPVQDPKCYLWNSSGSQ